MAVFYHFYTQCWQQEWLGKCAVPYSPGAWEKVEIISRGFIAVNFYPAKGEKKSVKAEPGESILRIAQHNGIPLEGRDTIFLLL